MGEHRAVLTGCAVYALGLPCAPPGLPDDFVVGEIMVIEQHHYASTLAALDRLEGYRGSTHPANLYDRVARPVVYTDETGRRRRTEAWVYVAGPSVLLRASARVPGGDWLKARGALAPVR